MSHTLCCSQLVLRAQPTYNCTKAKSVHTLNRSEDSVFTNLYDTKAICKLSASLAQGTAMQYSTVDGCTPLLRVEVSK